jgi:hypothetical protein
MSPIPGLTDTIGALGSLALAVAALLLIFGAPLIVVLAIRFLWYRHVYVGKSKELETLIFQLHRIASALEQRQASEVPADKPASQQPARPMPLSMFGR